MQASEYPGFKKLRFDSRIKAFNGIWELLMTAPADAVQSGKKIIAGASLSPTEPVYAAGGVAYNPFSYEAMFHTAAGEHTALVEAAVEAGLSPDFDPWKLVAAGAFAAGKSMVPVHGFSTVCGCGDDQVKSSLQAMAISTAAPVYYWEIPRYTSEFEPWAVKYVAKELRQWFDWLKLQTGHKITDDSLAAAITGSNKIRSDMRDLIKLQSAAPAPLPPLEFYVLQSTVGDVLNRGQECHGKYRQLLDELQEKITGMGQGDAKPRRRIYWLGEDTLDYDIFNIIADCGADLVGSDTRWSFYYEPVKESGNPVDNLADWTWRMPCNLPVAARMKAMLPAIREQKADVIFIHTISGSRCLSGAEKLMTDIVKKELGLPVLSLETSLPGMVKANVTGRIKEFLASLS
jgi:benzoyl-CoA reductase/2-hydroxyglutaryl-CoA dehydratase subunit BcrC/BadD/HgdB